MGLVLAPDSTFGPDRISATLADVTDRAPTARESRVLWLASRTYYDGACEQVSPATIAVRWSCRDARAT